MISPPPSAPGEEHWHFIDELRQAEVIRPAWFRKRPLFNEANLSGGVTLQLEVDDPKGLIETAIANLQHFLSRLFLRDGGYPIRIRLQRGLQKEAYRLEISKEACLITASDLEGIRRATYFLQDELAGNDGPFLKCGTLERSPQIRTRISRCFFGPINRLPANRDELLDDVNYYPDEYLNRLAHDGVNALWLTIRFCDLCPSRFFPEFGLHHQQRLEKLRETVRRCARYGIGIYLFCIEPQGFGSNPEFLTPMAALNKHPELAGHIDGDFRHFCTSTKTGLDYLEEATAFVFSHVPGLAGLIDINMGERPTHCYSNLLWDKAPNQCPRCSQRTPAEVLSDTLAALRRGMDVSSPEAELISWLYIPTVHEQVDRSMEVFQNDIIAITRLIPPRVTLQLNFESLGTMEQLGRERTIYDYSLAYIGPSGLFQKVAAAAKESGTALGAKLQIGCSHEVATVPWVPVPENLYFKYKELHQLGVRTVMQCWYFGNYPSIMTRAAGILSFSPLPSSSNEFLIRLAAPRWGKHHAQKIAKAWSALSAAYRYFPANLHFAWYGPVHDSVVWPLHLFPVNQPISPSWLVDMPPSGDRIGECLGEAHTLEEAITLCRKMDQGWQRGTALLKQLRLKVANCPTLVREIGVALALGQQIASAYNVLRFYAKREKLYRTQRPETQQRLLDGLEELVRREIRTTAALKRLSGADSLLGFHSEAEGYKYFPAKLLWRRKQLQRLLRVDFPLARQRLNQGLPIAPPDTGGTEKRPCYQAPSQLWEAAPIITCREGSLLGFHWRALLDEQRLRLQITCLPYAKPASSLPSAHFQQGDHLRITIEPRPFWPLRIFSIGPNCEQEEDTLRGLGAPQWQAIRLPCPDADGWQIEVTFPLSLLAPISPDHLRINIERIIPGESIVSWIPKATSDEWPNRLIFGAANPHQLGDLAAIH